MSPITGITAPLCNRLIVGARSRRYLYKIHLVLHHTRTKSTGATRDINAKYVIVRESIADGHWAGFWAGFPRPKKKNHIHGAPNSLKDFAYGQFLTVLGLHCDFTRSKIMSMHEMQNKSPPTSA
jgi:hypothetical protein